MTSIVSPSFLGTLEMRGKVERLESELAKLPQTRIEPLHHIHGGMYSRTGLIRAGTTFTGATHRKDHINVVCGDITILTDDGPVRFTGYHILPTIAGSKRVAHAHADTYWTTFLRTDLTEVHDIENECVENAQNLQTRKG